MITCLEKTLAASISRHIDAKKSLLLALSGGCDSMALLGLLLSYHINRTSHINGACPPLSLFVVYVDHRWREESGQEALALRQYVEALGIPFFVHALEGEPFNEEVARKGRLQCFHTLMEKTGSQAVCLAHHRDDQEETLIKRLFEGAGLTQLQGMQEFSEHENGLRLWRPLLPHRKQELLHYIEEKKIPHWKDWTNSDPRFLRARMRQTLIPLLRTHFGKEIGPALHHLHCEAQGLQEYLEARIQESEVRVHRGPLGIFWEWPSGLPDPYVLRYYLRQALKQCGVTLSREEVERTEKALSSKRVYYQIRNAKKFLFVDRGRLFLLEPHEEHSEEHSTITSPMRTWRVQWQQSQDSSPVSDASLTDWSSGWSGCWTTQLLSGQLLHGQRLPGSGSYVMRMPRSDDHMLWKGKMKRCHEIWKALRVPEPLRKRMPVIVKDLQDTEVVAQFLVQLPKNDKCSSEFSEYWTLLASLT